MDAVAISAIATAVAALVTALMAFYTRRMAAATERISKAAEQQIEYIGRQATAAEAAVEQTERTIAATHTPRLRLRRISDKQVAVFMTSDGFTIELVNDGPVKATITEASIGLSPQPVFLEPAQTNPIEPGGHTYVACDPSEALGKAVTQRQVIPARIAYTGPSGEEIDTSFSLSRKSPGGPDERWLIVKDESDRPHGRYVTIY